MSIPSACRASSTRCDAHAPRGLLRKVRRTSCRPLTCVSAVCTSRRSRNGSRNRPLGHSHRLRFVTRKCAGNPSWVAARRRQWRCEAARRRVELHLQVASAAGRGARAPSTSARVATVGGVKHVGQAQGLHGPWTGKGLWNARALQWSWRRAVRSKCEWGNIHGELHVVFR